MKKNSAPRFLLAEDEVAVVGHLFRYAVGQDRVFVQIGHLNQRDDAVFAVVHQKVRLAGVFQGQQLDDALVDIVIGDSGSDGEAARAQKAFVEIKGLQVVLGDGTDAGIGSFLNGTADHHAGNVHGDQLGDMGNTVGDDCDLPSCEIGDHEVSGAGRIQKDDVAVLDKGSRLARDLFLIVLVQLQLGHDVHFGVFGKQTDAAPVKQIDLLFLLQLHQIAAQRGNRNVQFFHNVFRG